MKNAKRECTNEPDIFSSMATTATTECSARQPDEDGGDEVLHNLSILGGDRVVSITDVDRWLMQFPMCSPMGGEETSGEGGMHTIHRTIQMSTMVTHSTTTDRRLAQVGEGE